MSATVYANLKAVANRMVTDYGAPITYKVTGDTLPDASKPWDTNRNDATYAINAVKESARMSQIDGQTVHAGDIWYLIASPALAVTPKVGDQIVDGSKTKTIKLVEIIGTDAVIYNCLARD